MRHTFTPWVRKILEKEMATHSSVLACEIPWTEEPGRLQSMGLERAGYNFVTKQEQQKHTYICVCVYTQRENIQFSSVAQLCPTLCNPMDYNLLGFFVPGILQARILEWVAISFSRIFLTQGSKPHLLRCRWILYHLTHQGRPVETI